MTPGFIHIPAERLRPVWPHIRDRIAALAADCGEAWVAEDVFAAISAAHAKLWVTPRFECFIVTQILTAPWGREFHVWVACNDSSARAAEFLPQVKTMAAAHTCDRVVFESPRRWERALPGVTVRHLYSIPVGESQ